LTAPVQQDSNLTDHVEIEGHRRPRRRLKVTVAGSSKAIGITLLLPDPMQVNVGHMEVRAKLVVAGALASGEDENDVLDGPLRPLRETHAVFQFVDARGEFITDAEVRFRSSRGEEIDALTDAFGEVYLDASENQTYTLLETPLEEDERLAVVESKRREPRTAVA
jgi:hypothetical protein